MKKHAREHFHEEQLDNLLDMWLAEAEDAGVFVKRGEDGSTQERLKGLFDAYRYKCVKTSNTVKQKKRELKQAKSDHWLVVKGHVMARRTVEKEVSQLERELEKLRGEMTRVEKERDDLTESNKEAELAVVKLQQEIQNLQHIREDCVRLEKEKNELVHWKEVVEREKDQLLKTEEEKLLQKEKENDILVHREKIEKLENEVVQQKDQKIQDLEKVSHTFVTWDGNICFSCM